jgi:OFA family oxalate/formate antiporter-like MFS transporter
MEATGTWATVLYTVAAMDLFAAFLAIVALRPILAAHVARSTVTPPGGNDPERGALATA